VALGFLALSACAWVTYRLGSAWFGRAAGAVAAIVLLTRVPVLSYGVRAYVDVPYMLLVLSALLVESRRPRAGAPVLALLGLAGLLRPEAWVFSGIYWVVLVVSSARSYPARTRGELARLAVLAAAAPAIWVLSDLLVTGNAMWSLTNTKHTAVTLGRAHGIGDVPQYIPRRIGEVVRPAVLAGAALGGVLSLMWLGSRARLAAIAGVFLRSARRAGELAARYGGEEFAVLLPGLDLPSALTLAEAVRRGVVALAIPHPASPTGSVVTVSLGVAVCLPTEGLAMASLVADADAALYRAKEAGRNRTA